MGGVLVPNDNDDVQLKGATDATLIGNTGDRLKVDAVGSSTSPRITYSASIDGLIIPVSPTDIFTITGSATKTIRVTYIEITGTSSTGVRADFTLVKRSTANSGGTSTTLTGVPHDSNNAAATATVRAYTVNPTTGTLVGQIRAKQNIVFNNINQGIDLTQWEFGFTRGVQEPTLRGTAQVLAVNLSSDTVVGPDFNICIEWVEE